MNEKVLFLYCKAFFKHSSGHLCLCNCFQISNNYGFSFLLKIRINFHSFSSLILLDLPHSVQLWMQLKLSNCLTQCSQSSTCLLKSMDWRDWKQLVSNILSFSISFWNRRCLCCRGKHS